MKKLFLIIALLMSVPMWVSCSDSKDEPTPSEDVTNSSVVSLEKYNSQVAGSLWCQTDYQWMDADGNLLSPDGYDEIGGLGISPYLFTGDSKVLAIYGNPILLGGPYDPQSQLLGGNIDGHPDLDIYLDNVAGDMLSTRTKYGKWKDPSTGERREDVYLQVVYKRLPGSLLPSLLANYPTSTVKASDFGVVDSPQNIDADLFKKGVEGWLYRSRENADKIAWTDKEGNVVDSGVKFNVVNPSWIYVGKDFYITFATVKNKKIATLYKGAFNDETHLSGVWDKENIAGAIYFDKVTATKIMIRTGEGLYKENGVTRDDVWLSKELIRYSGKDLSDLFKSFTPANFNPEDVLK